MNDKLMILDGAMGTMLQNAGLKPGDRPEVFGMENPDIVTAIHKAYLDAGSNILYANTFGANRRKLAGSGVSPQQAVEAAVSAAKKAAASRSDTGIRVALDVGPVGELLEPLGTLSFEEAYDCYREMVVAGERAGVDLIVFETFTDLYDAKAALLAAKEHTSLPVWVTMSFETEGRTFTGTSVSAMGLTLTGLGADALGINCSLGPQEIYPLAAELAQWTDLPLVIKPNAGLPDPHTGCYILESDAFARQMEPFLALPVEALGGCCGTTPAFILALQPFREQWRCIRPQQRRFGVCSASHTVEFAGVKVVGERLNPTGKRRLQQALKEHDMDYVKRVALEQEDAGADILDINVGVPGLDERSLMMEAVKHIQGISSLPLQIDSSNKEVLEAGLRTVNGRAIINSVNGEEQNLHRILPLARKYGAAVIGLTMDETGIPQTAEGRFAIAERILKAAEEYGMARENLLIDCLTLTVSAQQEQAAETLKAVRMVKERLGLHCILGVSNISFGLPERSHISESFLTQALYCGLDFPMINPNMYRMMDAVVSYRVLSGEDKDAEAYIRHFAENPGNDSASAALEPWSAAAMTMETAMIRGLKEETSRLSRQLLQTKTELELINEILIPTLDLVGEQYEKQIIFLPQLMNAANAACAAFDLIKERIAQKGGSSIFRGKILLATVKGDIHDIGKNIVKVILENYGYQILDLGRDVSIEKIVDAVVQEEVALVGLSALMTTTVPAMEQTIKALRKASPDCKIWVGGAVLTPQYAAEIGADYYAKDARESVAIARKIYGI